jgi:hypothetical protein
MRTGNQQHPQRLCIHALHCNFAEPARTDDLCQPPSVIGIGLVDLQLEGGLGVPGDTLNRINLSISLEKTATFL